MADGHPLLLDACTPDGPGPYAAVILVHGGGWMLGNRRGDTRSLFAPLTQAHLAWFSIEYRLAPAYRYPACVDDVKTAIVWVKAHAGEFNIDPRRIALLGESAGGHLVSLAGIQATPATRVAAIVDFYGSSDLVAQVRQKGKLTRDIVALFGRSAVDPQLVTLMQAASPVTYVHAGLPPFLIVHGTADPIVPYAQAVELAERLRACGDPCELMTIPGGNHAMGNWGRIEPDFRVRVAQWIVKTLAVPGPVYAAVPVKAGVPMPR
jgi:alpha-L-fucosidase 2